MSLSPVTRLLLGLGVVLAVIAFALVVEFGISAGRVHEGVTVRDLDVGGQTLTEAIATIDERGRELQFEPVVFTAEGFDCDFVPDDLGWGRQAADTAAGAMAVGRTGGLFRAVGDRVRAWTGGVVVRWDGAPEPAKVTRFIDRCEREAVGLGLELDRGQMRFRIRQAIVTWPRRVFEIPVRT